MDILAQQKNTTFSTYLHYRVVDADSAFPRQEQSENAHRIEMRNVLNVHVGKASIFLQKLISSSNQEVQMKRGGGGTPKFAKVELGIQTAHPVNFISWF